MQRYRVYLYLETALHVSGGTSTHHQERIQLYLQQWLSHRSGNRQPKTYVKPEAAITVFEPLMMSGVSPETC
jgi:hypothetical protein